MNYIYIKSTVSVLLTTRERGAYIWVEKCVTNSGDSYSGDLMHGRGDLFTEFYGIASEIFKFTAETNNSMVLNS